MSVRIHSGMGMSLPRDLSTPAPGYSDTASSPGLQHAPRTTGLHADGSHRLTQQDQITELDVEEATRELTEAMTYVNKGLQFRIHDRSERLMVHVIDRATQEVIKEIPPEEFLNVVANIQEYLGLLFDERA